MNISISVPDDLAHQMGDRWEDLPRHALEALATSAYRSGVLTVAQVRRLLGHASRFETHAFLKQAGAYLDYTEQDLDDDLRALAELSTP